MKLSVSRYSAKIGNDPALVQGAGGNVSWKEGDILYVKASGTWLADAEQKDIFISVDLRELRAHFARGEFGSTPTVIGQSELRPSIETSLHAVMPQKVVVHTHPIDALVYLVRADCNRLFQEVLDGEFNWALVEYRKPGAELGAAVYKIVSEAGDNPPEVIFLANHGVIVAGESLEDIEDIYGRLQRTLAGKPRDFGLPKCLEVPDILDELGYKLPAEENIQRLAFDPLCQSIVRKHWALYPDHVVFLGKEPSLFEAPGRLADLKEAGVLPDYAIIPDCGVFIRYDLNQNKTAMLKCFADVLARLDDVDNIRPLPQDDVLRLLNWEAEKYRSQIAK